MAGRKKHADRAHRAHRTDTDMKNFGLYRMASVVERGANVRRQRKNQQKGAT